MNTTLFFYLVHPLVALFASVGYAIVCNAPRKEIPYCGLTAFLCAWCIRGFLVASLTSKQ